MTMLLRYSSENAEHHAVRRAADLFDLSHMGEVEIAVPGAGAASDHAVVTNHQPWQQVRPDTR